MYIPERNDAVDLFVENSVITAIEPDLPAPTKDIQAHGALLISGFVESHIHLDKACILKRCHNATGTLEGALASVSEAKKGFTMEDVYARGARVIEKAIVQGTNAMRTHVEIDPVIGLVGIDVILNLKQDFAWALDLQICVFPQEGLTNYPGTQELLESALRSGSAAVGLVIGGALILNYVVASENIPNMLAAHLIGLDVHPLVFLLSVNLLLLLLGCILDATTIILVIIPLFIPACLPGTLNRPCALWCNCRGLLHDWSDHAAVRHSAFCYHRCHSNSAGRHHSRGLVVSCRANCSAGCNDPIP